MTLDTPTAPWNVGSEMTLYAGRHASAQAGHCIMEAVSVVAHEPFCDTPDCVDPVLAAFARTWNDTLDDERRQQLRQYIPLLIGSKVDHLSSELRARKTFDWVARVALPLWLDAVPELQGHGAALRRLRPVFDSAIDGAARDCLGSCNKAACELWSEVDREQSRDSLVAERAAAWSAAWEAIRTSAWGASWAAATTVAWDPAVIAARQAAQLTLETARKAFMRPSRYRREQGVAVALEAEQLINWAIDRDQARAGAWSAIWSTARVIALRAVYRSPLKGFDVSQVVTRRALEPITEAVNDSAHQLLQMLFQTTSEGLDAQTACAAGAVDVAHGDEEVV